MDITYDEWFDKYKPKTNKHGDVIYFETYGDELDTVIATPNEFVWTVVDGGEYFGYSAGRHFVNRMNYIICEIPWDNEDLYVDLYEPYECEESGEHSWMDYYREMDGKTIQVCEFCEMNKEDYEEYDD